MLTRQMARLGNELAPASVDFKRIGVILGLYWGYIGDILGIFWGYIGDILGLYWGYIGIMEKKMETTI